MLPSIVLHYILAIFVIVGLVSGPLTTPVAVGPVQASSSVDKMPCCSHKPADCEKCLLGMLSKSNFALGPFSSWVAPLAPLLEALIVIQNDHFKEGLGASPPSRPPRTLA